jgi:hypothetical protein
MIMAFVFVSSLVTQVQAVTIDEIHKSLEDARQGIKTIHIIRYEEELTSKTPLPSIISNDQKINEENFKREKTFQNIVTESDIKVDLNPPRRIRLVREDARDLNEYFKSENLPLRTVKYISQDKICLAKENRWMRLINAEGPEIYIEEGRTAEENFQVPTLYQTPYFGIPDAVYFTKDQNFVITERPPLVCVDIKYSNEERTLIFKFELDPALGYRLRSFRLYYNNEYRREIIAEDYKDVNGIPYPFVYKMRYFKPSGETAYEENFYAEKVTFNEKFKEEDFRMFVPPETSVVSLEKGQTPTTLNAPSGTSARTQKIKGGCYLGVDDIQEMVKN